MPITPTSATPDLDAFLRLHDDAGPLPGEATGPAQAGWLCWMCWATPVTASLPGPTGR